MRPEAGQLAGQEIEALLIAKLNSLDVAAALGICGTGQLQRVGLAVVGDVSGEAAVTQDDVGQLLVEERASKAPVLPLKPTDRKLRRSPKFGREMARDAAKRNSS